MHIIFLFHLDSHPLMDDQDGQRLKARVISVSRSDYRYEKYITARSLHIIHPCDCVSVADMSLTRGGHGVRSCDG